MAIKSTVTETWRQIGDILIKKFDDDDDDLSLVSATVDFVAGVYQALVTANALLLYLHSYTVTLLKTSFGRH